MLAHTKRKWAARAGMWENNALHLAARHPVFDLHWSERWRRRRSPSHRLASFKPTTKTVRVQRRALSVILYCEQIIGWNTETLILRARQSTCPCQSLGIGPAFRRVWLGPIVGNPCHSMATELNLSPERNRSYLSKMRFSSSCWMITWRVAKIAEDARCWISVLGRLQISAC